MILNNVFSRSIRATALFSLAALALTACDHGEDEADAPADADAEDTGLTVMSSIDVYADLIDQITAGTVDSQAVVSDTSVDPHSYEATPQDRLAAEEADVIVANGGGYDSFITLLASSAGKEDDVYQLIPGENEHSHEWDGSYENEHIWYDLERMEEFVLDIAETLGDEAPDNAEAYQENADALAEELQELQERNESLDTEGLSFLATEAVSGFLLEDAGFENYTEEEFLSAVEHGDDVSPRLYNDALDLTEEISLLSYNSQTETQQSERIRNAAEDNDVTVLEFTETLPEEVDNYQEWMHENIDRVEDSMDDMNG